MNILVTGAVGFIGFSLCESLIKKKHKVFGIDNFDTYYSIEIKKKRLKILNKNKNFYFKKIDITHRSRLFNFFKKKKIDIIIHLAAQAGVRYSLINPKKYVDVNIFGFLNIIELAKEKKIKKFIYASSSSVYGDNKKFPLSENQSLNPKNIYGLSKQMNEQIASMYSKFFDLKCIGLRFFTIYGEWGRPDMFLFKLFKATQQNKKFYLNNYGNHKRDFTYVKDAVKIVLKLINYKIVNNEIFNICSNKPIKILDIIKYFKKKNNVEVKLIEMHRADVKDTHGDNKKIKKALKRIKFSKFYKCLETTYEWYKKNNISKI
jgi:UDP-glucuronate 4-epimerase